MKTDILAFIVTFSSILWEAMPFIVLGAMIAGVLEELLPQTLISRLLPRYSLPAVVLGALLGLVFPMCECGIVVVMRRLLRKGLPLSCCVSYMLAGPIINIVVMLSTYVAFGGLKEEAVYKERALVMVGLRCGLGFVVACVTGLVVHVLYKRYGNSLLTPLAAPPAGAKAADEANAPRERKTLFRRLSNISETTLHDFVDITVFLILGAGLAAVAKLYIQPEQVQALSRDYPYLTIPLMMALAVLMCLCSEADAFVAASFTEMSVAPKMAFLVLGPMLDLKLLLMYTRVFRPRLIAVIVTCTAVQSGVYTILLHTVYDPPPTAVKAAGTPAVTPSAAPPPSPTPAAP